MAAVLPAGMLRIELAGTAEAVGANGNARRKKVSRIRFNQVNLFLG